MHAERLSAAVDQLIGDPQAQPGPAEASDVGLFATAHYLMRVVEHLGPVSPALEQRVDHISRQQAAGQKADRLPRLRLAWAVGGLAALLVLITLLTPTGQTALASFMAVFHLGRTEVSITPGNPALTQLPSARATEAAAGAASPAVYQDLTLEEAQVQMHLAIPQPAYLPVGYRLRAVRSCTYPDLPAWIPQPFSLDIVYESSQGPQVRLRLYPIALGDKASISGLNLEASPIQDVRDVDVNGQPGVLLRLGAEGAEAAWQEVVWEQGELILALSATSLTEDELLRMARSIR
jgi:hypothetical protein